MAEMIGKDALMNFLTNDAGQDLIEYAMISGLIALAAVVVLKTVASSVGTVFAAVGTALTSPI